MEAVADLAVRLEEPATSAQAAVRAQAAARLEEAAASAQAAALATVAEAGMEVRKSTPLHRRATPEPTKILRLMLRQRTSQELISERRMRAVQMQS
jgi:hypothetical protein